MSAWLASTQVGLNPYDVEVLGKQFRVFPGVFSPLYYSETAFFASHLLPRLHATGRFLDVGCGVGVNSVLAAAMGVDVVALDINPTAIENTTHNLLRYGLDGRVQVRQSDIFSALLPTERFDVIYWNIPFTLCDPDAALTPLEEAIFDPGYRKNRTFIARAKDHLNAGGEVLLGISPTLGDPDAIKAICATEGYGLEVVAEGYELDVPEPVVLQLIRLTTDD
jgi:methylase of polypeptide subunit release factors